MGKITLWFRTFVLITIVLSPSVLLLSAFNKIASDFSISGTVQNVSCNGDNDGKIILNISGGTAPYDIYSESGILNGLEISQLAAGSYTVIVTDALLIKVTKIFVIEEPAALFAEEPSISNISCHGLSDGQMASGSVSGGTPPYYYSLDNVSFNESPTFSNLSPDNYTLHIKDAVGCSLIREFVITEPSPLSFTNSSLTPVNCKGDKTASISVGATGGTGSYSYSLNNENFAAASSFSNLGAGMYTIRVKDAAGCENSTTIEIPEPQEIIVPAPTVKNLSCSSINDGRITIINVSGGAGNFTYSLNGGNFSGVSDFPNLSKGNYIITVRDELGCLVQTEVNVLAPEVLSATVTSQNITCNGANNGTISITNISGGNGTYEFSITNGAQWQDSPGFTGLTPAVYKVLMRDKAFPSCTALLNNNLIISQPAVLSANISSTNVTCFGGNNGAITITAATGGSGTFQYSINNGTSWQDSGTFNSLTSGTYPVQIRDKAIPGCIKTLNAGLTITQPVVLNAIVSSSHPSCSGVNDGRINISSSSGGFGTYQYSINNGSTWQESPNFNNLNGGTYQVLLRDKNYPSCSKIIGSNLVLVQPATISMTSPAVSAVSCYGGTNGIITAGTMSGGTSPFTYSLNNSGFQSLNTFTGLSAGSYTIFVKDSKGCAFQQQVEVTQPGQLAATTTSQNVSCFGSNTGSITVVNPTGGSGSYQYQLGNGTWQTGTAFNNLITGTYTISIRDAGNTTCIRTLPAVQITQPASALTASITSTRTTTYGTPTGTATVNPTGGTGNPYTFEWRKKNETSILQNTQTASDLLAGTYTVKVIDANGCSVTRDIVVVDRVTAEIKAASLCEDSDATLRFSTFSVDMATVMGGIGNPANYTFTWNFGVGANAPVITGSLYKVTYSSGGDKTISLTVTDQANISTTLTFPHYVGQCFESCGGSQNYQIDSQSFYIGDKDGNPVTGSNCTATTEKYLWFTITKAANAYALSVELKYAVNNGSSTSKRTAINCFGERTGTGNNQEWTQIFPGRYRLFRVVANTTNPAQINWDCGQSFKIEGLSMRFLTNSKKECGDTNNSACIGITDETEVSTPIVATATVEAAKCHGQSTGSITINAQGGVKPYQYSINGNVAAEFKPGSIFSNLPAGTYSNVWVKDSKGLTFKLANITLGQPATALSATISATQPICFGNTGSATATPSGGTPFTTGSSYKYLWNDSTQQTTATATGLLAGNYTVTITDANGCQELRSITISQPAQITVAAAGPDQSLNCGFNTANLSANPAINGMGSWSIIAGPGGAFQNATNPNTTFQGVAGNYILRWTIANATNTCSSFDDVLVNFAADCSTLDFDGVDDYVTFGDTYKLNSGPFTIEAWVKLKTTNGIKTVLSKRNSRNLSAGGYDLIVNFGAPTFRWGNNSLSTSHLLTINRWYHLAVINNGTTTSLYVDGLLINSSVMGNSSNITPPFVLGAMYDSSVPTVPQNYFHGWIEEVRIWKTAITEEQLRFMMNQRLVVGVSNTPVRGAVIPLNVPGDLTYDKLDGYYQLIGDQVTGGLTKDMALVKVDGQVKNVLTKQENSAPLPYSSKIDGVWSDKAIWAGSFWEYPNALGINSQPISWNIAKIQNTITSGGKNITVLGLLSEDKELIIGNPNEAYNENNSGQSLTVTHYLKLNGNINLAGESQLIQTDKDDPFTNQTVVSYLDPAGPGYVTRAQQGTASSYNYNYWSSPVMPVGNVNAQYTVGSVMMDGSSTDNYGLSLAFGDSHEFADGEFATPRKISNYWIYRFSGTANAYGEWKHIGSSGSLKVGEGYTMKGTSKNAAIIDPQNYLFKGKPNNGTYQLTIDKDQNYLIGNPYPSALDAHEFILDHLKDVAGGRNSQNIFDGSLYFWDHFAGKTHILAEYVGGYAVLNLLDGVPAISVDDRINNTEQSSDKRPERYIPVGQAFLINSAEEIDDNPTDAFIPTTITGGTITFKNSQRKFKTEGTGNSTFLRPEILSKEKSAAANEEVKKLRISFKSPMGYSRQILVGANPNTSNGYDPGYDAKLLDYNEEDMYWIQDNNYLVIQGVPHFNSDRVLKLGVKLGDVKDFSIKLDETQNTSSGFKVYLRDLFKDSIHDLTLKPYVSQGEAGDFNERFEIVFNKPEQEIPNIPVDPAPPVTPLPTEPEPVKDLNIKYFHKTKELIVSNPNLERIEHIELLTITGAQVENYSKLVVEKEMKIPVQNYSSGIYIVKLHTSKSTIIRKVILNN